MVTKLAEVEFESVEDMLLSLGGISPKRVRWTPRPGTATVRDLIRANDTTDRIYELVDGTLVEKVMGFKESTVALRLSKYMQRWNDDNGELGVIAGEAGTLKLMKKLVARARPFFYQLGPTTESPGAG